LLSREFGSVIRPDMLWDTSQDKQLEQLVDDLLGGDAPAYFDRQTLAREFIDDIQGPECPAVNGPFGYEIVAPDMVFVLGTQPDAGTIIEP